MFFCCKQKTAYELRISDWSSDVCSSDLPEGLQVKRIGEQEHEVLEPHELGREAERVLDQQRLVERLGRRPEEEDRRNGKLRQDQQIGERRGPEDAALLDRTRVW